MKRRIYIAGPMRGMPRHNYPAFDDAAEKLRADGWTVENPAEISARFGTARELDADPALLRRCMDFELAACRSCDAIFLLKGWTGSVGARAELVAAIDCNLEIIEESDWIAGSYAEG